MRANPFRKPIRYWPIYASTRVAIIVALLALLMGLLVSERLFGQQAQWIWNADQASGSVPIVPVHFRKSFPLPKPVIAELVVAADDEFQVYFNNELVGYGQIEHIGDRLAVCILRDTGDHRRTGFRMAIVRKMIADLDIDVLEMESVGKSPLARMFSLIQWGDYVSFYLAMLYQVDPTPVQIIDHFKECLAQATLSH